MNPPPLRTGIQWHLLSVTNLLLYIFRDRKVNKRNCTVLIMLRATPSHPPHGVQTTVNANSFMILMAFRELNEDCRYPLFLHHHPLPQIQASYL